MISKKYIVLLFCWLLAGICYASLPVESETIINNIENPKSKFDLLAFLIGVFSAWTLPYNGDEYWSDSVLVNDAYTVTHSTGARVTITVGFNLSK